MTANFEQARVEVDRDVFLRMAGAQDATIVCLEGSLWITQDDSAVDVQLDVGQSHRVEGASPVIVCGFGPSLARVRLPAAQRRFAASGWLGSLLSRRDRQAAAA